MLQIIASEASEENNGKNSVLALKIIFPRPLVGRAPGALPLDPLVYMCC